MYDDLPRPVVLVLGTCFIGVGIWGGFKNDAIIKSGQKTTGIVVSVNSENERCGNRIKHDCTTFTSAIQYRAMDKTFTWYQTNTVSGHNAPITYADYQKDQEVEILYDPTDPSFPVENTFEDKYGWALIIIACGGLLLLLA
ncbi:MAG: DUF3592 domain-containing protein [Bdellovibrionales bacterium]|nr:DUF3592 domain-containing protein [Bdellovibrionales bacterium]